MDVNWARLSWRQAEEALKQRKVALVPVGSTEQHGHHLPTGTDAIQASYLCSMAAEACGALVTPAIPFGHSENHMRFPGTISVQGETLKTLVKDVARSLKRNGVRTIVLFNSHGGNVPALALAAQELNVEFLTSGVKVISVFWPDLIQDELKDIQEQDLGTHADEVETSNMLVIAPELVRMDEAVDEVPDPAALGVTDPRMLRAMLGTGTVSIQQVTTSGTLGRPSLATTEKGRRLIEAVCRKLASLIAMGRRSDHDE